MAVKTIAELAAATSLADTDVFIIDDGSRNYKITWGALKNLLGTISGFTADNTEGTISITLSTGAVLTVTPHDPTKQDKLTFDTTPTMGSVNPVTSGGVKAALDDKMDSDDYVRFTGATGSAAGTAGIVPAPAAGGSRYLSSEGTWMTPDSVPASDSTQLITSGAVYAAIANNLTTTAPGKALDARQGKALSDAVSALPCLVVNCGAISSLPKTVTNSGITADMVVLNSALGTPSAQTGDWTVTTAAGSLTISGTISGSTTLTLYLCKSR